VKSRQATNNAATQLGTTSHNSIITSKECANTTNRNSRGGGKSKSQIEDGHVASRALGKK
jgi:hypothetical protein